MLEQSKGIACARGLIYVIDNAVFIFIPRGIIALAKACSCDPMLRAQATGEEGANIALNG